MELYGHSFLREEDLMHHGIKGQKWGVCRFQNEDGTWTAAGKKRYSSDELRSMSKQVGEYNIGKQKNLSRANNEKRDADAWYEKEGQKLKKAQPKIAPKDYDKAWDNLGKELSKRHDAADTKRVERDKKLASDLKKKYGIDVDVSAKEIQRNPIRTAMAVLGNKKSESIVNQHGNMTLNKIQNSAMDGDGWTSSPKRPSNVVY